MISRGAILWSATIYVATAAFFAAAAFVPAVPYNIREVMGGRGLAAPLILPFALSLLFGTPVWGAARLARRGIRPVLLLPATAISSGVLCYALLRVSVPMESLWDIVGAPILAWAWEWELLGRFVALYSAAWILTVGGAVIVLATGASMGRIAEGNGEMPRVAVVLRWAAVAVWALPLCYGVIVSWAATDNLTELIAGGGSPLATLSLALCAVALAASASVLAALMAAGGRGSETHSPAGAGGPWKALLQASAAFALGYFLLQWGAEARLTKYGATFSALQFLLSPDRDHYVTGPALLALTLLAQGLGIAAVVAMQLPYWIQLRAAEGAGRR